MICSPSLRMGKMVQVNPDDPREAGLEILAEWIAEAFLEELEEKSHSENSKIIVKENSDANKRNQRSNSVAKTGQNPLRNQKR